MYTAYTIALCAKLLLREKSMSAISAQHRVTFGRNLKAAVEQECQEAAFPLRILVTELQYNG